MGFAHLLIFTLLSIKAIVGNEVLHEIIRLKDEMLSDLSYYKSCADSGEYQYADFETESHSYYQRLAEIESIVTASVRLIMETRNASADQFDSAFNDTRRLKDEGFENIRLHFYSLYTQSVAYRSQLAAIGGNVSAIDENNLPCQQTSPDYDSCLDGVLSTLQSTKAHLMTVGSQVCTSLNSPSSGSDYVQTVYSDNTEAAKETVNSQLTQYAITRPEIVAHFNKMTQTAYDATLTDYHQRSEPYETQLKDSMYRKLNTLNTIVNAVNVGIAHTNDSTIVAALKMLNTRVNYVYTSQYNFITGILNAITAFDFVGQLTAEREKVNATNMQTPCETTASSLTELFMCTHTMYTSYLAASDSISNQYDALVYLDFPKDTPWWRIMNSVPLFINTTLYYVPTNSKLEKGLKCFRDYHIVYRTAGEIEIQYNLCSVYF